MIEKFENGFHRLTTFFAVLVALSIASWAILIPLDFALVRLGWGNLPWMTAVIEYSLYAGVFLGAPWVLQQNGHVRVDVLVGGLPEPTANRLEFFVDAFGCILCLVLAYFGVLSALEDYTLGELNDKYIPLPGWQLLIVFIVAFIMLAIEFAIRARHAFDPKEPVDPADEVGF